MTAYGFFKVYLSTVNPWPTPGKNTKFEETHDEEDDPSNKMAMDAWDAACDKLNVDRDITREERRRVSEFKCYCSSY